MPPHIAIVEDERALAENYRDALHRQGFQVSLYADRSSAQAAFEQDLPDLAIIDIGLGDEPEAGFELCRDMRSRWQDLPIVFLTARESELDIVSGLRLGADDYFTKDISLNEMFARLSALLRRARAMRAPERQEHILEREALCINRERLTASWRGESLGLTVIEFRIVHSLAERPGHVKSRDQLMSAAGVVQDDSTITSHIKRIRRKFEELDPQFDRIDTVYGLGYRWSGD
ncbi:MAG: proteobacterial dedicated sortase system response regulator [Gammaproteobacteria bacterium]|nr:proteobacterial dedicated sortase system response regulator [Gammaproteobacteria bacterium]